METSSTFQPIVYFVIPLRSAVTTDNWPLVSALCNRTLKSVCRQTNSSFKIILVYHELPENQHESPHIIKSFADWRVSTGTYAEREHDKWVKLHQGLCEVRRLGGGYVMFMDADDLVSNRLVQHVIDHQPKSGYTFRTGYHLFEGSKWLYRYNDFDLYCGSSSIVKCTTDDLPSTIQDPRDKYYRLYLGHTVIRTGMADRGKPLDELPFPGALYIKHLGNHSNSTQSRPSRRDIPKRFFLKMTRSRLFTTALKEEFGYYPIA